jgi:hypothetical protein
VRPQTLILATALLLYGCAGDRPDPAPVRIVAATAPAMPSVVDPDPWSGLRSELERRAADEAAAVTVPTTTAPPAPVITNPVETPVAVAPSPEGDVLEAIARYFPDNYDSAVGVADCESSLDPSQVSAGGGNWGLFQINTVHKQRVADMGYSWSQILDPYVNSAVAAAIYNEQGWSPWACKWAA